MRILLIFFGRVVAVAGPVSLPVATLPAGEYLLRIEAAMKSSSAGRALRFRVE